MKIKVRQKSFKDVMEIKRPEHRPPKRPPLLFRTLLGLLSLPEVLSCRVKFNKVGMERLGKKPAMILMNHSCFLDLKMASVLFYDRPFNIVCTSDGFVGKSWLMRNLGCIPTQKFVTDMSLVRDIKTAIKDNGCSVLMYPEASYTFDGTATPLPESLGKLLKLLKVPVVSVITNGAFLHDPLYNGLKHRRVKVSADVTYLLTPEDIEAMTPDQINQKLREVFSFDGFRWQQENGVRVDEKFRADYLNRVLYKCPHCLVEGKMKGQGTSLTCTACGKEYTLDEYGRLCADDPAFTHIPDWYAWERECVRRELEDGRYCLQTDVDICAVVDYKAVYRIGSGQLTHDQNGFHLTGCEGGLDYSQPPLFSYGLYADYYWYELGDMICIGNKSCLYYCFPRDGSDIVAKTRLAAEELYKMNKNAVRAV